jgi:bla regulator protein blaR1
MNFFSLFIDAASKGTILLLIALGFGFITKRSSASTRYLVWSGAMVSLLALPFFCFIFPSWNVAILPSEFSKKIDPLIASMSQSPVSPGAAAHAAEPISPGLIFMAIWAVGFFMMLGWWGIGLFAIWNIRRKTSLVTAANWCCLLQELSHEVGLIEPPKLLTSHRPVMPMTWGIRQPVILLPEECYTWSDERRRVLLLHELAHIKRKDSVIQMILHLTVCLCHLLVSSSDVDFGSTTFFSSRTGL